MIILDYEKVRLTEILNMCGLNMDGIPNMMKNN